MGPHLLNSTASCLAEVWWELGRVARGASKRWASEEERPLASCATSFLHPRFRVPLRRPMMEETGKLHDPTWKTIGDWRSSHPEHP